MKVLCIKQGLWTFTDNGSIANKAPKYGDECTVTGEENDHYYLLEYPVSDRGGRPRFAKKQFIPISNIDERELVKEREENMVTL